MVEMDPGPGKGIQVVTIDAVGREAGLLMVWFGGGNIFVAVAIDAVNTQRAKQQEIGRGIFMTGVTVGRGVGADQRKPASLVDLGDVVNHPGIGRMASCAIGSHGLVVHVGMARHTLPACFGKFKGDMAHPAVNSLMLTGQWKCCRVVVER